MSDGIKTGRKKEAERDRRGNGGAAGAEHYRGIPVVFQKSFFFFKGMSGMPSVTHT